MSVVSAFQNKGTNTQFFGFPFETSQILQLDFIQAKLFFPLLHKVLRQE